MYKSGQIVTILNQDDDGNPIIEGEAALVDDYSSNFTSNIPHWKVRFTKDNFICMRSIYPQEDIDKVKVQS